ncbi:MAG: hypothetical protein LBJ15_19705 [Comamonas sp.]|jgi:hypothetical protein|uniref:hypothetical protein n=1 Tax=Comamonas sp. TaxID=34028 RepID=UPI002819105B|nr:hypothetical protein [Comamonas sp.]MDR0216202.1 hypothetical protein [Comamonas sp.]
MSNITPIRKTRRAVITAHQVTFELVPQAVIEDLFYAAIAVGWSAGDGAYTADGQDASDRLASLRSAVSAASQYTVPVEREINEPVFAAKEAQ